jgi:cytochrome c553
MKASLLMVAMAALVFAASGPAQAAGDADAGKALAKKCAGCHGANGEGKKKNPPVAGMAEDAFVQAMQDYKSGKREHKAMARAAKKLSDEDFANMAAYYAGLK